MKYAATIILGASLLSLVSCGKKSDSDPVKAQPLLSETAYYKATFSPLNAHLAGDVTGDALIKIKGGIYTVQVRVNGAPTQMIHAQHIHMAKSCPTLSSDVNKDGIIDSKEGTASYGKILIPLDGDLRTQLAGIKKFPSADFSGNYYYGQNVPTKKLLDDLMAKDADTTDQFAKLKSSNLDMTGRQIVIYGIAANTKLPKSVAAPKGQTPQEAMPIACGTFAKIDALEEGNSNNGRKD